jgi:hypothetical protein
MSSVTLHATCVRWVTDVWTQSLSVSVWVGCTHKATLALWPFSDLLHVPICFHSYITESRHSLLVPKNVYRSDEMWIQLKPSSFFPCRYLVVHVSPTITHRAPCSAGGMYTYYGVLPGALKGLFATLQSLPQCHAAFGMVPHVLALVGQSPVCRRRT